MRKSPTGRVATNGNKEARSAPSTKTIFSALMKRQVTERLEKSEHKKTAPRGGFEPKWGVLLAELRVAVAELVHATGGVDQLHLARVERVGEHGNFHLDQGVLRAVHLNGFFGVGAGFVEDDIARAHIFEGAHAVALGVNSFFHRVFYLN
jgi:hypothetical protein